METLSIGALERVFWGGPKLSCYGIDQPVPMDPYGFYNVPVTSMQEILQVISNLDRNCCFESFMADLDVCNCNV